MNPAQDNAHVPVFEIDQPGSYGDYIFTNPLEVLRNLRTLQDQRRFVTLYLDEGQHFFLSTVLAVDAERGLFFLDAPSQKELLEQAKAATKITLSTLVDRVKIQLRLREIDVVSLDGSPALRARIPDRVLRLQRREFFRIDTPRINPLRCKLAQQHPTEDRVEILELPLHDISGGGMCLIGPIEMAERFQLGTLFADCRLEIPGESPISLNLRIREVSRLETLNGDQQLRLGCEFINLSGARQSLIERYITRLERERKARENGLS